MRVVFSHRAARNLDEIGAYIVQHNPEASDRIVQRILDHCSSLKSHPLMGRSGRVAETRELVIAGTSYLAAYRLREKRIEILAILHAAREWPEDF